MTFVSASAEPSVDLSADPSLGPDSGIAETETAAETEPEVDTAADTVADTVVATAAHFVWEEAVVFVVALVAARVGTMGTAAAQRGVQSLVRDFDFVQLIARDFAHYFAHYFVLYVLVHHRQLCV